MITAVGVEKRRLAEVAAAYGVHLAWIYKLLGQGRLVLLRQRPVELRLFRGPVSSRMMRT